jgi:hypothetical protein
MKNISQFTRGLGLHFTQSRISSLHQLVRFSVSFHTFKSTRARARTHKYAITEPINITNTSLRGTKCLRSAKFICLGFITLRMQVVLDGNSNCSYCFVKKSSLYLTETVPLLTTSTSWFRFFQKTVT